MTDADLRAACRVVKVGIGTELVSVLTVPRLFPLH
jgi:hypothetical protein